MLNLFGRRFYSLGSKAMKNNLTRMALRSMTTSVKKVETDYSIKPKEELKQFSKAPIMDNFGELKFGEIPEPLKYVRPFNQTTLSNGIRVCSEASNSPLAAVGVFIKAGSRNENMDTNGVAFMLERLLSRGTENRTATDLAKEIEGMGGVYEAKTLREITSHTMKVFKNDVGKAVEILADMVTNPLLNDNAFEAERELVSNIHENNHKEYERTTLQAVHYNSFRDHMIGQPSRGDRDNLPNLTIEQVRQFHNDYYHGDNIVVVATGNVNHQEVVDMVERHFSSLPKSSGATPANSERPVYTPSLLFMRDDEMINTNVGVFYDAPGLKHPDYFGFELLKRIFGTYNIDKNSEHLNDCTKQYNAMHTLLGDLPDVTLHKAHYFAYSDCGLFGNYFFGNEVFTRMMTCCGFSVTTLYGNYINEVEIFRARNKLYNELLASDSVVGTLHTIGNQILQLNRRVPRSEVAKRVAHIDGYHIKNLCYEWFYDAEPSVVNWGPCESTASFGTYKYYKIHTMGTVTSMHHALYF